MPREEPGWEHGYKTSNGICCNYCKQTFKCTVSRFKFHIAKLTGHDIAICNSIPSSSIVEEMRAYLNKCDLIKKKREQVVDLLVERQVEIATNRIGSKQSHHEARVEIPRVRKRTFQSFEKWASQVQGESTAQSNHKNCNGTSSLLSSSSDASGSIAHNDNSRTSNAFLRPPRGRLSGLVHLHPPRKQTTIESSFGARDEQVKRAQKILAQFWFEEGYPLLAFKKPMFQRVCDAIAECGPGNFVAPTYTAMRTTMLQEVKEDINVLMQKRKDDWAVHGCSILSDGWKDRRDRALLNFMVASISGTMFLKSIDATSQIKTADMLCEEIKKIVEEVGSDKVITDNASSYKAAGRLLMIEFPTLYWTPCAAHCIDLLLEDISEFPWVKRVLKCAKFLSKFINNHTHVHHLFLKYSNGKEIIRAANTRFATNYILLSSMMQVKQAIMDTFQSNEWKHDAMFNSLRKSKDAIISKDIAFDILDRPGRFWFEVNHVIEITKPLVIVLRQVDEEKPSLAFIYAAMSRAKNDMLLYMKDNGINDRWPLFSNKIYERWNDQMHTDLHAIAHILNPRFGFGRDFDDTEDHVKLKNSMENAFDKLFQDSAQRLQVAKDMDMYRKKLGVNFSRSVATLAKDEMTPDNWWRNYGLDVPTLKAIAVKIVSQPCSSSGCERNWSVFEHVHSKKRNRLTATRLNDLVYVQYNLKLDLKELAQATLGNEDDSIDVEEVHPFTPLADWVGDNDQTTDDVTDLTNDAITDLTNHAIHRRSTSAYVSRNSRHANVSGRRGTSKTTPTLEEDEMELGNFRNDISDFDFDYHSHLISDDDVDESLFDQDVSHDMSPTTCDIQGSDDQEQQLEQPLHEPSTRNANERQQHSGIAFRPQERATFFQPQICHSSQPKNHFSSLLLAVQRNLDETS